jgi:hypothetical protein
MHPLTLGTEALRHHLTQIEAHRGDGDTREHHR